MRASYSKSVLRVVAVVLFVGAIAPVGSATIRGGSRVETFQYVALNTQATNYEERLINICAPEQGGLGCVEAQAQGKKRFVSISIEDATGQAVPAIIRAKGKPVLFCGETQEPVDLGAGGDAYVFVLTAGDETCPGPGTTGTVTLTYSSAHH